MPFPRDARNGPNAPRFESVLYNTIRKPRCKPMRPSDHPDARIGRNTIESN